jgi:glycosyltransferase involved in cell wall biosynthesis
MKVALVTPAYWPEVRRGTERLVHDLAAGLAERGHEPHVITSHRGPRSTSAEDGVTVVRVRRPPEPLLEPLGFQTGVSHLPFMRRELARLRPDVVHAFALPDAAAAAGAGPPLVYSYMGIPTAETLVLRRGRTRMLERVKRDGAVVIGLSAAACDSLREHWGIEARLVYPGVDLTAFHVDLSARAPQPVIACAASPDDPRKGVLLLVDAFALARRERPDARLILMRPSGEGQAAGLAADAVELRELRSAAVPGLFREAWASALLSRDEAFGLVVAESLACGTPAVALSDGGPAEILAAESIGALVGEATPEAVAQALLRALELAGDPATAERCRARAEQFGATRMVSETERLYRELHAR